MSEKGWEPDIEARRFSVAQLPGLELTPRLFTPIDLRLTDFARRR